MFYENSEQILKDAAETSLENIESSVQYWSNHVVCHNYRCILILLEAKTFFGKMLWTGV